MKELLLTRENLANKISYYHLALFVLSLPFDRFYSHLILASFGIHTLLHFNKLALKPFFTWRTLILQSIFFLTVLSTIYSPDKQLAFREWGLYIPVLVLPILFCINPVDLKKYGPNLMLIFSLGCAAAIIYLYGDALLALRYYHLPYSLIFSASYTNHNFSQPIDMHATFFSMQIGLALVFMLSRFIKERQLITRLVYGFLCLILLMGIIQLSSKSVFAALFLVINVAVPLFLLEGRHRTRFILTSASVSVVILAIIAMSGTLRERYLTELKQDFSHSKNNLDVEPRLMRWEVAASVIKQSPIIGHGAGSEIPLLKEQYFQKKFYVSYLNGLNAHNEYLSLLIKSGIIGLAVYIITLFYGFRAAIRKKDIVFFALMTLMALVSLSENVLDADKGVIFYSFFFTLCVFTSEQKEQLSLPRNRHKNLRDVATKRVVMPSSLQT
jgi:O-antigen ligase